MKVEKSAYMGIRMDAMYAIYLLFAVAVIARSLRQLVQLVRPRGPVDGSSPASSTAP